MNEKRDFNLLLFEWILAEFTFLNSLEFSEPKVIPISNLTGHIFWRKNSFVLHTEFDVRDGFLWKWALLIDEEETIDNTLISKIKKRQILFGQLLGRLCLRRFYRGLSKKEKKERQKENDWILANRKSVIEHDPHEELIKSWPTIIDQVVVCKYELQKYLPLILKEESKLMEALADTKP